jgi:hypothetical protein
MDVQVDTQPRIDTLVTDAANGEQRRRTEYLGTVWIDGRAQVDGMVLRRVGQPGISTGNKDVGFYVPDSLPYRSDALAGAQLSVSATLQASGSETSAVIAASAGFVDDPSGAPTWVHVKLNAFSQWPCAIAYRIVALTPPDAIAG